MTFRGNFYFLSNMYPCTVEFEGQTFQCVEAAFQAAKCIDKNDRLPFTKMNGFSAKSAGRRVKLRPNWNQIRTEVMEEILRNKFSNPELRKKLKNVSGNIQEDNTWNDTFWGVCYGRGLNNLGKILMKIRDEEV